MQLADCLNVTVSDPVVDKKAAIVTRNGDDLHAKVTEYQRNDIKIGAKVFLNHPNPNLLREAIDSLFEILQIDRLDNLILAYHPLDVSIAKTNGTDKSNGYTNGTLSSSLPKEGLLTWGDRSTSVNELKKLWQVLEEYADENRICQLGIADLDTDTLINLYTSCRVKPIISQINLSACCVVPPSMQEFCAKNEIQLLTHSDSEGKRCFHSCLFLKPSFAKSSRECRLIQFFFEFIISVIVSKETFNELSSDILQPFTPNWTSRYQVHIKCRGVLTARGFLLGAERD